MLLAAVACLWLLTFGVSRRLLGSLLSPMMVFASAWLVCIALFESGLVRLFRPAAGEQALLLAGIGLTLAGGYVVTCGARHRPHAADRSPLPKLPVLMLALLAFGGFAILVFTLGQKVSLWVYWIAPQRAEEFGFQRPGIGYLNLIHIVLPAVLVVQGRRSAGLRGPCYVAALLSVATTPFAGIKAYFVQSALTLTLAVLYESGRARVRSLVLGGVLVTLVAGSYFVFYDRFFRDRSVDYVGRGVVDVPAAIEPLSRPLIYATGPIAAFGSLVRFEDDVYFGKATLRAASRLAAAFEPVALPPSRGTNYGVPIPFNTYGVFREAYEDGREAGVVIIAFLTGFVVQGIFLWMRRAPSIPRVVFVAYVTAAQVLSPFAGFLFAPQAVFFAMLLLGLDVLTTPLGSFRRRSVPVEMRCHE